MTAPIQNDEAAPTARPSTRPLIIGIYVALAIASAVAAYLLRAFMLKTYGIEAFESACSFGESFDCDRINTSDYGKLGGFPLTVFAIPTYAALAALAWLGSGTEDRARGALRLVQLGSALAVAYGLFLIYVMVAVEGTFCLFCLTMDAMAAVVLALATSARNRLGPTERNTQPVVPAMIAIIVGGVLLLGVTTWHDDTKADLVKLQIAQATKTFDNADSTAKKLPSTDTAAGTATATATASAPAADGAATAEANATGAAKLGDNLYRVPVDATLDPVLGPADAKVTIVEYADFQCGYCKKLFYALKTVKDRYKDRVRFVFKHFPMNTLCNKHIKNNRHKFACNAALTAECARRQDKFWPVHDLMFKNQHKLEKEDRDHYAEQAGLDMAKYAECMNDRGAPRQNLKRTMDEAALGLSITATPRTFINGKLLTGAVSAEVLDAMIVKELEAAGGKALGSAYKAPATPDLPPPTTPMVEVKRGAMRFFIDTYEASVDAKGRALSLRGVKPANLDWDDANKACNAAGKRLCSSKEWVTACQGAAAKDDDGDKNFANDYVKGNQFPYADYYEQGWCYVTADSRTGRPRETGSSPRCRTPDGIYDLAGNVEEWVEKDKDRAFLAGGDFRAEEKANCVRVNDSFGPGHRNHGIGFRCCADKMVANASDKAVDARAPETLVGEVVPELKGNTMDSKPWSSREFIGKVTFLTFFASWCSPCQREFPELNGLVDKYGSKGFQVVAIGVDTDGAKARAFAGGLAPKFPVIIDPDAELLGRMDVQNMPTGYVLDRKGRVVHKQVGFGTKTIADLTPILEKALK